MLKAILYFLLTVSHPLMSFSNHSKQAKPKKLLVGAPMLHQSVYPNISHLAKENHLQSAFKIL